jgi:hypothetical protein
VAAATTLAQSGYVIDVAIMVWGFGPAQTMYQRLVDGYPWVPSALQPPVQAVPGISIPGVTSYNPKAPPNGAVSVSINPADYPPFALPNSPPVVITDPVGDYTGRNDPISGLPEFNPAAGVNQLTAPSTSRERPPGSSSRR